MTHPKLRSHNTQIDNLVGNLRGEVGEVILSWILFRDVISQVRARKAEADIDEMNDPTSARLWALADRLEDDIVARLSELGEKKIGRLTFHFAAQKLDALHAEDEGFRKFVQKNRLTEKRNRDISHKELPEKWSDRRYLRIPYPRIVRALAMAVRLMKKIDRAAFGPAAPFFWRKLRERRYEMILPGSAGYMIAPLIRLSERDRANILNQELLEGKVVWESMEAVVNGQPSTVQVNKEWAAILFGSEIMFLEVYPLVFQSIDFGNSAAPDVDSTSND